MAGRAKKTIKKSSIGKGIILEDAWEEYITFKQTKVKKATISSYESTYKRFSEYVGKDTKTKDIVESTIYAWVGDMKIDNMKKVSIDHFIKEIRVFLYWCMHETRKYIDPSFKVSETGGQEEETFDEKTYDEKELTAILQRPQNENDYVAWRTYTIINLVMDTGLRASSIVNILMRDVDLSTRDIYIRHTKNNKPFNVDIAPAFYNCLKEYIRDWRSDALPDDYLFVNEQEKFLTTRALRLAFMRYCKNRGVVRINPDAKHEKDRIVGRSNIHGLRHTFAKEWIVDGGNHFVLQDILGHSSLEQTRKYVKFYDKDRKVIHERHSPLQNRKKNMGRRKTIQRNYGD
ncbi:MAG: site-specific integrase [Oscillospiraceae bacterium]|jgi:integrase/recombinase XerD|nr:site-specific integrase [Oscillospiraceae bacterium]